MDRPEISILVVNPNSTKAFTEAIEEHFTRIFPPDARPRVNLRYLTAPPPCPTSIMSVTSSVLSAAYALPAILPYLPGTTPTTGSDRDTPPCDDPVNAIVIACFSAHPLVTMLRELTSIPVVGIMEAGLVYGSQLGGKLGIVTTDLRWQPLLEHEIKGLGMSGMCGAGVVSSGMTVLELESADKSYVSRTLCTSAQHLVTERRADVILLGCAGMVGLDHKIQEAVGEGVLVLDPVRCGVELALSLARMKVKTAKSGLYERAEVPTLVSM